MSESNLFKKLLVGKSPKKTLIRLMLFTIPLTYILAKWVFLPTIADGKSMEPTIPNGKWLIICPFKKKVDYGQIVSIRMAGKKVGYLKRIVGLPGDKIAFRKGILYLNGNPLEETYLKFPSNWEMKERLVPEGKIYVVGDNRSMPIKAHKQGLTDIYRIIGSPLF